MAAPPRVFFLPPTSTRRLHAGGAPDPETAPHDADLPATNRSCSAISDPCGRRAFNIERSGHVYSRISNPTNAGARGTGSPRWRMAVGAIRDGQRSACTASGGDDIAGAGSHIVASACALSGGSHNLLHYTMARFQGSRLRCVNATQSRLMEAAIRPNTRMLFARTLAIQRPRVLDIPRSRDCARSKRCRCSSTRHSLPYSLKGHSISSPSLAVSPATKFLSATHRDRGLWVDGGTFLRACVRRANFRN